MRHNGCSCWNSGQGLFRPDRGLADDASSSTEVLRVVWELSEGCRLAGFSDPGEGSCLEFGFAFALASARCRIWNMSRALIILAMFFFLELFLSSLGVFFYACKDRCATY